MPRKSSKKISKLCGDYEISNRKTGECVKCPSGHIKRNSYIRKLKKTNKKTYVHEACIKSRGLPGKTGLRYTGDNPGIGPLRKGELGKHGYHSILEMSDRKRQTALISAVKEFGAPRIVRKLGALRTYLKNTAPKSSQVFYKDQRWVRKYFDSEFKGDYKTSKLYTRSD